jgi:hypothetical protein
METINFFDYKIQELYHCHILHWIDLQIRVVDAM